MNSHILAKIVVMWLLLVSIAHVSFGQSGNVYAREDIRTFSKDSTKVAALRKAVEELQSRKPDNATSWLNMANIHGFPGSIPADVPPVVSALYAQCHKREEMFFLWHRAYVWSIERLMQEAIHDAKFRLPYWDWYSDPALPEIFRNEFLDAQHTLKNSLYVRDRKPVANAGRPIWPPAISTDFTEARFGSFQDSLNFGEHGTIHVAVGTRTNMGNTSTAARDPIFWLHHANIDRLLPVWKKMGAQHIANTDYPDWKSETYRFPVPSWTPENPATVTPTVEQLALNATDEAMGYTYENTDPPKVTEPKLPLRPGAVKSTPAQLPALGNMMMGQAEALSSHRDIEIGPGGTVKLTFNSHARNKLMQLAQPQDASAPPLATIIVLSNVQLVKPDDNVLSYQVFLNLPVSERSQERFHDHFLGSVSIFALAHAGDDAHHSEKQPPELRFEATKALSTAVKAAGKAEVEVNVSVVPVLAPDAKAPTATVLKIGEIRLETPIAK